MGRPASAQADMRAPGISGKLGGLPTTAVHAQAEPAGNDFARTSGDFHARSGAGRLSRGSLGSASRARPTSAPVYSPTATWADTNTMRISTTYMDAAAVLGPTQAVQAQLAGATRRSRPKSACVTAAAWKAYGSPNLRGQVRPASPPAAAHPKATGLVDALHNRQPTVGMLGGGFHYPPAGGHYHAAHHRSALSSPTGGGPGVQGQAQGGPEFNGRMINDPPVPAVPQLLQPFQPRTAEMLMAAHAQAPPGDAEEYRYLPTRPTDPTAQRAWSSILAKYESKSHGTPQRPQSARRHSSQPIMNALRASHHHQPEPSTSPRLVSSSRPCSARPRFTSMPVGTITHLGISYSPPAVTGSSSPAAEHVLPGNGDARWASVSRMGATAMGRIAAGLKLSMDAAVHTGSPSRPTSPFHMPGRASVEVSRTPATVLDPQTLLAAQQAELEELIAKAAAQEAAQQAQQAVLVAQANLAVAQQVLQEQANDAVDSAKLHLEAARQAAEVADETARQSVAVAQQAAEHLLAAGAEGVGQDESIQPEAVVQGQHLSRAGSRRSVGNDDHSDLVAVGAPAQLHRTSSSRHSSGSQSDLPPLPASQPETARSLQGGGGGSRHSSNRSSGSGRHQDQPTAASWSLQPMPDPMQPPIVAVAAAASDQQGDASAMSQEWQDQSHPQHAVSEVVMDHRSGGHGLQQDAPLPAPPELHAASEPPATTADGGDDSDSEPQQQGYQIGQCPEGFEPGFDESGTGGGAAVEAEAASPWPSLGLTRPMTASSSSGNGSNSSMMAGAAAAMSNANDNLYAIEEQSGEDEDVMAEDY